MYEFESDMFEMMQEASVHLIFHDSQITDAKFGWKPNNGVTNLQDVSSTA